MKKVIYVFPVLAIIALLLIAGCAKDSPAEKISERITGAITAHSCEANLCEFKGEQYFCPEEINTCEKMFDSCEVIKCLGEKPVEVDGGKKPAEEVIQEQYAEDTCDEDYNDCTTVDGEEVICHGSLKDCKRAFESCECGVGNTQQTDDDTIDETFDFNSDSQQKYEKEGTCETGVYICTKESESMDGEPTNSSVKCKASFSECSVRYGNCTCGEETDWFEPVDPNVELCDWDGFKVPCDRICKHHNDCHEPKSLCDKGNGILVTCDGAIGYCWGQYDNKCICGSERIDQYQ